MIALIKTFTYLFVDIFTHAMVIYFAVHLFGYEISISETGLIAIVIEACEMTMYFFHEKAWERVLKRKANPFIKWK